MPKHRKNEPNKKNSQNKKAGQKPQKPILPQQNANNTPPEDIDDDVSAAVAAYLSNLDDTEQAVVAAEVRRLLDMLGDDFDIVDAGDDDGDSDELSIGLRPRMEIEHFMQKLIQDPEMPTIDELFSLSDLTTKDIEIVRQQWSLVEVSRRRAVVADLVALAAIDIDVELSRFLRVALRDEDAPVRRDAIRGLWESVAADLVGPFVQMLQSDPDVEVRATAASGLGGYILAGELDEIDASLAMRAEEALLAILNNEEEPVEVRRRALESVAFSGEAGVRQLIEDGYYDVNEAMRVSAVFAMGRSADVRWRGLVRAELQSPSAVMRAEAAFASGELGAKTAAEDVSALLQDVDEKVRLAAIAALGRIGGPVAQDALEAMLLSENPVEVEATEDALEELQLFAEMDDAMALFDEAEADDEWESDGDDDEEWYDEIDEDDDLGEYEDDADDDSDDIAANRSGGRR